VRTFRRFFSKIFLFFDLPQYSNRFDYIRDRRRGIYFNNHKNHCISSLRPRGKTGLQAKIMALALWPFTLASGHYGPGLNVLDLALSSMYFNYGTWWLQLRRLFSAVQWHLGKVLPGNHLFTIFVAFDVQWRYDLWVTINITYNLNFFHIQMTNHPEFQ